MYKINVKQIIDEDFANYKKPSMFIAFPKCNFKCGAKICQNAPLAQMPNIESETDEIVMRYVNNPITEAIVFGGLEPFDSFDDMLELIGDFRKATTDPIIIYTGYYDSEIKEQLNQLKRFSNIIVKFGRYVENREGRYDPVLGVTLASFNQYAVKL